MKKKLLEALKTKFVGVDEAILERMATKKAEGVTDESQITGIVDGINFQDVVKSYGDYRANEANVSSVKNYEEKLVGRAFARCNSGYLVNLAQVSGVQQDMVQVGPYTLQISRPRRKAFMAGLADYIGGAGQ